MERRKIISCCLFGVIVIYCAVATTEEAHEPRKLIQLRKNYQQKIDDAIKPIQRRYKKDLEALQRQLLQMGNFDGAVLVKEELRRLKPVMAGSELSIIKATYGSSEKNIDVTERLQKMVHKDKLRIEASGCNFNKVFKEDPHVGIHKALIIEFSFEGRRHRLCFMEGEEVCLP